jgi:hypothetical protein
MSYPFIEKQILNRRDSDDKSTFSKIQSVWHTISWLFSHKQYAGVGFVLAEYAIKTAFAYLPSKDAQYYCRILRGVGVDVEHIGLVNIGESMLDLSFPGMSNSVETLFGTPASRTVNHLTVLDNAESALANTLKSMLVKAPIAVSKAMSSLHLKKISDVMSLLMNRVQSLGKGLNDNHDVHHDAFASYLLDSGWVQGMPIEPMELAKKALQYYDGSHWFDVGLSTLNRNLGNFKKQFSGVPDKSLIQHWLIQAYHEWALWGKKMTPILEKNGQNALHEVAKSEADTEPKKSTNIGKTSAMFFNWK